ncbi:MAG: cation-translocating P-type ATPase [Planctomycetaceae bacterium]|jgi:Ca2+-transporting ATPase|nr:cation-translocating P-type ATPase [Planctomycetaceae bacterium]
MNLNMNPIQLDNVTINPDSGLSDEQINLSVSKYGTNLLTPPSRDPWWKQLLEKFNDPTIKILIAAAIISILMTTLEKFILNNPEASFIDSIGIVLAVALATLAGFFSELKSAREFDLLNKVKDDIRVKVFRNGDMSEISINEIVVGDIIQINLGDKIPADGIIINAQSLLVDQSVMTGESVPVEKIAPQDLNATIANILSGKTDTDDVNQVYRGTMISDGHGKFIVTAVGDKTKLGQIAANLGTAESESETPLTQKLSILAKQISIVGVSSSMAIFSIMAGSNILKSDLFNYIYDSSFIWYGLIIVALIAGGLAMRFVLCPFFRSMDMELKNPALQILATIPMFIAILGIGVALTGVLKPDLIPPDQISAQLSDQLKISMDLFRQLLLSFIIAVTIIVVAVPEGLPMMVTVSLAMNMMKMAKENCLIRKLVASETIGSATIVCSDKTGTLTQNRMTVTWIFADMKEINGTEFENIKNLSSWNALIDMISTNSEAVLKHNSNGTIEGIGNPTECALLRILHDVGADYLYYRNKNKRAWELSHNSARKMSIVAVDRGGLRSIFAKGAPERLIDSCSHIFINNKIELIEPYRNAINTALSKAQSEALRVIAFTSKESDIKNINQAGGFSENEAEQFTNYRNNILYALIGISDPIREEVPHAVDVCHNAGVNVKMITGDAEPTAIAIAKKAGILSEKYMAGDIETEIQNGEVVLTSAELAELNDEKLVEAIPHLRVLARSTPMDKLRLVKAMHKQGEVVAMTGDGTNDAPALKFADVGISMGITGTEVAKEASDIVLIDDNFKSIVTGIWWGRTLYQNIQKFLQFQLSVNVVALTLALLGPLFGVPLPLTVPQLLWINIIMDTFAAIALSTDPPRTNSMRRKPIKREASIITKSMALNIALCSLYQVVVLGLILKYNLLVESSGHFTFYQSPHYSGNIPALTVFFTAFVMFQFWNIFNSRSLRLEESPFAMLHKNLSFIVIVILIGGVQICLVQASNWGAGAGENTVGLIGSIFRTNPLSVIQLIQIAIITVTIIPVAWCVRFLIHKIGWDESLIKK